MKRVLAGLLILVLLASGCAYAAVTGQEEAAYLLYFREADLANAPGGDALRAETVYLDEEEQQGVAQVAQALMEELLAGPVDETLVNTIPAGTTLLSLELDGARALVDLSSAYSTLSGVELTLADYAIALTLTQLPEIASVSIMVRGKELAYRTTQRFSPRDVTPEATLAVCQRLTPGIPEAMRYASMQITPRGMLSRAQAGIRGGTLIVNLPGSPKAAKENLEAVLPILAHGLEMLSGAPADCAALKD